MYNYTVVSGFDIENVDHEIHILGVTPTAAVYSIGVYWLSLPFLHLFALVTVFLYIFIARELFLARERGEPVEYQEKNMKYLKMVPILEKMFGLDRVIHSKGWYRG